MANSIAACGGAPEWALPTSAWPGGTGPPRPTALAARLQPRYHRPSRNLDRFTHGLPGAAGGDVSLAAGWRVVGHSTRLPRDVPGRGSRREAPAVGRRADAYHPPPP